MPTLEQLRKKFEVPNGAFIPTPENQARRMKQQQDRAAKESRIAKARAARYNMTLRSLALKQAQDQRKKAEADMKKVEEVKAKAAKYNATSRALDIKRGQEETQKTKRDQQIAIENKKKAAKYNMTKRALPLSVVKKDQVNIGKALGINVMPDVAKETLTAVATNQIEEEPIEIEVTVDEDDLLEVEKVGLEVERDDDDDDDEPVQKIEMGDLATALESGDDDAVNRSILITFLETNAPKELPKLEEYLVEYRDRLQELFDILIEKYPGPHDAELDGQQKADKEIVGDVDEDTMVTSPDFENAEEITGDVDDDSIIALEATKGFRDSYNSTIEGAEEDPGAVIAIEERWEETQENTEELRKEVSEYNQKSLKRKPKNRPPSISSDDSLVIAPEEPAGATAGYITEVVAGKKN